MKAEGNRFICPVCQRTLVTIKSHAECKTCGQAMMRLAEWLRRQAKKEQQ